MYHWCSCKTAFPCGKSSLSSLSPSLFGISVELLVVRRMILSEMPWLCKPLHQADSKEGVCVYSVTSHALCASFSSSVCIACSGAAKAGVPWDLAWRRLAGRPRTRRIRRISSRHWLILHRRLQSGDGSIGSIRLAGSRNGWKAERWW